MSLPSAVADVEYPESDGKPMGETDIHRAWMNRLCDLLRRRYAGQRVYVGCNLFLYYVEGSPFDSCVPDVFVVKDCDPRPRRTFKLWEEGRTPDVVFEVTSRSTRREDDTFKPQAYARIGVKEYFLFDPTSEYLLPPLKGFRLAGDDREPILPDKDGALVSHELGLRLWLEAGELILADAATGERLLTDFEAADARAEAAEQEVHRLREQLAKLQQRDPS
jgi:Uma2 family endonuclease